MAKKKEVKLSENLQILVDYENKTTSPEVRKMMGTAREEQTLAQISSTINEHFKKEVDFKILVIIPMLYQGWECDPFNYLVEVEGKTLYIGSSHGGLYIDEKARETGASFLKTYKESTEALEKALSLLK